MGRVVQNRFGRERQHEASAVDDVPGDRERGPVVDARAISALLDSFILVVEWGRTTTDVVEHALNTAPNVYDTLLGVVLNKTDMKAMKRYATHYGDYYNDEHYIRYGQLTAE